jgi:hypothetical protein
MTTSEIGGYLAKLPADRREALAQVRAVINAKLPKGYEERFQYGMISWCVPESVLPAKEVYNKQPLAFASLGSKSSYMTLHLMSVYGDPKERVWLEKAYKQAGKKLDMGAGCLRFKSLEALPLDVIGEVVSHVPVDKYVDAYRAMRASRKTQTAAAKAPAKKPAAKKPAAKKPAKKSR